MEELACYHPRSRRHRNPTTVTSQGRLHGHRQPSLPLAVSPATDPCCCHECTLRPHTTRRTPRAADCDQARHRNSKEDRLPHCSCARIRCTRAGAALGMGGGQDEKALWRLRDARPQAKKGAPEAREAGCSLHTPDAVFKGANGRRRICGGLVSDLSIDWSVPQSQVSCDGKYCDPIKFWLICDATPGTPSATKTWHTTENRPSDQKSVSETH